ncbi:hypothetical protein BDF22DRAFT_773177 [Syncephalis plumigaleata]|nr:hypothetical protein BDF22DRAFT_773177 [Syncephalis plumigaleata]
MAVLADSSELNRMTTMGEKRVTVTWSTNDQHPSRMNTKSDDLPLDHVLASQQGNTESDDENKTLVLQWTSTDETDTTLTAEKEEEDDDDNNSNSNNNNNNGNHDADADNIDTDGQTTSAQHPATHPIMDTMRAYLNAATSRFFKSKDVTPEDTLLRCTEGGSTSTTTSTSRASSPPINSSSQPSPVIQQPALRRRGRSLRRMPQSRYDELTNRSSSLPPDAARTRSSLGSMGTLPRRGSGQRSPQAARFTVFDDGQPMTRALSTQSTSITTAMSPDTSNSTLINPNNRNSKRNNPMLTEQLWGLQRPPMIDLMPAFAPPVPAEDLDRVWATVTDSITDGSNHDQHSHTHNNNNNNNNGNDNGNGSNNTSSNIAESNLSSVNEENNTNTNTNTNTATRPSAMVTYGPAAGFLPYDLISTAVYSTAYPELYPRVYPPARSSAPTPPPPPPSSSSLLTLPTMQLANTIGRSSTGSSAAGSVCSVSHTPQSSSHHGLDENLFHHGISDKRNLLRQNRLLRTQLETMRALLEQAKSDLRQEREARRIVENCHQDARLKWEAETNSCMQEVITVRDDNRRLRDLVESLGGDPDSGSLLEADSILTADIRRALSRNDADTDTDDEEDEDEDENENENDEDGEPVHYASHWYDSEVHADGIGTARGTGKTGGSLRRRGTIVHLRPHIIPTKEQPNSTEPAYRVGADLDRFSLNQFDMNSWMDEADDDDDDDDHTNGFSHTRSKKSIITTPAASSRASFYSSSDEDDEDDDENDNETSSTNDLDDDSGDDDDDEIKPDISHICPSVPVSETELDDEDDEDEDEAEDRLDTNKREDEDQRTMFVDTSSLLSSTPLNTLPLLPSSKLDTHSTTPSTRNTYRRQSFSDIVEQYLHQAHTSHLGVAAILLAIDDLATKHAAHNENMLSIIIGAYLNAMDDTYACEADTQFDELWRGLIQNWICNEDDQATAVRELSIMCSVDRSRARRHVEHLHRFYQANLVDAEAVERWYSEPGSISTEELRQKAVCLIAWLRDGEASESEAIMEDTLMDRDHRVVWFNDV